MSAKLSKPGLQHYLIFLGIFLATAITFQLTLVNKLVQGFIMSQFKPEKGELVQFGSVWASPAAEGGIVKSVADVKADMISKEYIYDFTSNIRNEKEHGYNKASAEWYVKAPRLGEEAIILQPYGFSVFSFDIGFLIALIATMMLPPRIGFISQKFEREINHTKDKIRLQTGFSHEVVDVLTMSDNLLSKLATDNFDYVKQIYQRIWDRTTNEIESGKLGYLELTFDTEEDAVNFRNQILYNRIREYFSDSIVTEIINVKGAGVWQRSRFKFMPGLRLYMVHHFTEKYSNNVTGLAYGGAAFLIIAVGIRGLKFIPSTRPSLIFFSILLEFSMLSLLAITLVYTEEEERMDKMLKKMEDASKSQLDELNKLSGDMHSFAMAFEGGTSELMKKKIEDAVAEFISSNDNVESAVAKAIGDKLIIKLSNENAPTMAGGKKLRR